MIDEKILDKLRELNQRGLFVWPNEDLDSFFIRVEKVLNWSEKKQNEDLVIKSEELHFSPQDKFSVTLMKDSGTKALESYGALPDWVPAYATDQGLPMLAGGMAIHFIEGEDNYILFQLRSSFKNKDKWLFYGREEIIAHEMCHVARMGLMSHRYEETLAYQVSSSSFRRYLGGALLSHRDSIILLFSLGFLLTLDFSRLYYPSIPSFLGRSLPLCVLSLGLIRNFRIRKELFSAQKFLKKFFPKNSKHVLFRLNDEEIKELSQMKHESFNSWWSKISGFRGESLRGIYGKELN